MIDGWLVFRGAMAKTYFVLIPWLGDARDLAKLVL